jgi:hypothetical protein
MDVNANQGGLRTRARLGDRWPSATDAQDFGGLPAMPMPPRPRPAGPAGLSQDRTSKQGEVIVGHQRPGGSMVIHDIGALCDDCEIL